MYTAVILISLKHCNSTRETSTHRQFPQHAPIRWVRSVVHRGQSHFGLISSISSPPTSTSTSSSSSSSLLFLLLIFSPSPLHPPKSFQCLTAFFFPNPAFRACTPSVPNLGDICCKAEQLQPVTRQLLSTQLSTFDLLLYLCLDSCLYLCLCLCLSSTTFTAPSYPVLALLYCLCSSI